jgi:hypothetical protein
MRRGSALAKREPHIETAAGKSRGVTLHRVLGLACICVMLCVRLRNPESSNLSFPWLCRIRPWTQLSRPIEEAAK